MVLPLNILVHYDSPGAYNVIYNTYKKIITDTPHAILFSKDALWEIASKPKGFDIIHFHWPEYIFPWLGGVPSYQDLEKLKDCLIFYKSNGTKIVVTRHNTLPHKMDTIYYTLYDLLYQAADGIIHYGNFSKQEFLLNNQYPKLRHTVIPHPAYEVDLTLNLEIARKKLNIPKDAFVFLSSGRIRHFEEQIMVIKAFERADLPNAILILLRSLPHDKKPAFKSTPFKRIKWELKQWSIDLNYKKKKIFLKRGILAWYDLQLYIQAANCIFIPRINTLNSGIVPLAFSCGKTTVGPAVGNMKELLELNGNPLFDPKNNESIQKALRQAMQINLGQANQDLAFSKWSSQKVGSMHLEFYQSILKS